VIQSVTNISCERVHAKSIYTAMTAFETPPFQSYPPTYSCSITHLASRLSPLLLDREWLVSCPMYSKQPPSAWINSFQVPNDLLKSYLRTRGILATRVSASNYDLRYCCQMRGFQLIPCYKRGMEDRTMGVGETRFA